MYILVNVARHKNVMGEIVSNLVSAYGVPVSIVDDIQKICPRCAKTDSLDENMKSDETTEHDTPASEKRKESVSSVITVSPSPSPSNLPLPVIKEKTISTVASKPVKTVKLEPLPPVVLKEAMKISEPKTSEPAPKKPKLEMSEEKPELFLRQLCSNPLMSDAQSVFETAIANAFQNTTADFEKALESVKSFSNVSDDGGSNSDPLDMDDDDYANNMCLNPQFLASFISSTPNIFANSTADFAKLTEQSSSSSSSSSSSNAKRDIPPHLSINGKMRRGRIVYSSHDLGILEQFYNEDPNACADPKKRDQLCKTLSIDYHRLKVWFQNRRRKDKIRSQIGEELNSSNFADFPITLDDDNEEDDQNGDDPKMTKISKKKSVCV